MTISYELSFRDEVDDCLKDPSCLKELIARATGVAVDKVALKPKPLNGESDGLEYQKKLLELWREFLQGRYLDPGFLKPLVRSAWENCIASGVNSKGFKKETLTKEALGKRILRRAEMLDAAQPVVRFILELVRVHVPEYILSISDEDGYLISTYCSPEVGQKAEELYIIPGARFLEENVGNNGIGMALRLKEPVLVTGAEHFNELYHQWTCFGMPLCNANSEIIGAISLTIPSSLAPPYFFDLVIQAGRAIENDLHKKYYRMKYRCKAGLYLELLRKFDLVFNKVRRGIIIVDSELCITECNYVVLKITGYSRNFILGKHIKEILPRFEEEKMFLHDTISEERNYCNNKVTVQGKENELEFVADTDPILDERDKVLGVAVFLNRFEQALPELYPSFLDGKVNESEEPYGLRSQICRVRENLLGDDTIKKVEGSNIAVRWKDIRHKWKLGKKDFAERVLCLNPNQYYRYENGNSFPTLPKALQLASKLKCSIAEIYEVI